MANQNKVRFGLKNVYYAIYTVSYDASNNPTYTYSTPVKINGAVSLDLDNENESTEFFADDVNYYNQSQNNGYSGSLEVAEIPETMYTDVWGEEKDANGVFVEKTSDITKNIALMYQISGDDHAVGHLLYNVALSKPNMGGETMEGSRDPQTYTMDMSATALPTGELHAHTGSESVEQLANWFKTVYRTT